MNGLGVIVPMLLKMIEGERIVVAVFGIGQKERLLLFVNSFDHPKVPHA